MTKDNFQKMSSESSDAPSWVKSGRIPCLDGLRAISVLAVLACHWAYGRGFDGLDGWRPLVEGGRRGVDVFFCISGFLITLLLLREADRKRGSRKISLRGFYRRRILRIIPAYIAFLLFVLILRSMNCVEVSTEHWLRALSYTMNMFPFDRSIPWIIGHLWSLCVEEHFYFIWPFVFFYLDRSTSNSNSKFNLAVIFLCLSLFAAMVFRFIFLITDVPVMAFTSTLGRYDAIGWGCLLAYVAWSPRSWPFLNNISHFASGLAIAGIIFTTISVYAVSFLGGTVSICFGYSLEAAGISFITLCCVLSEGGFLGRLLELKPIMYIGTLSYSIYLWHQPFLDPGSVEWYANPIWNIPLSLTVAYASYRLIERPFLRLKAKSSPSTA